VVILLLNLIPVESDGRRVKRVSACFSGFDLHPVKKERAASSKKKRFY
jgi:hypothetical protein